MRLATFLHVYIGHLDILLCEVPASIFASVLLGCLPFSYLICRNSLYILEMSVTYTSQILFSILWAALFTLLMVCFVATGSPLNIRVRHSIPSRLGI